MLAGESSGTGLPVSVGGGYSESTSLPSSPWLPEWALGKCLLKLSWGEEDGIQANSQTELGCSGYCEAVGPCDPETPSIHSLGRSCAGSSVPAGIRCWIGHQGDDKSSCVFGRWRHVSPGIDSGFGIQVSCLVPQGPGQFT